MSTPESGSPSIGDFFKLPDGGRPFIPRTEARLTALEQRCLEDSGVTLPAYIENKFRAGSSAMDLKSEFGMSNRVFVQVCDLAGIARPSLSDNMRQRWKDQNFRTKRLGGLEVGRQKQKNNPNLAESRRRQMTAMVSDPAVRKKALETRRRKMAEDPEYAATIRDRTREMINGLWADPDFQDKMSRLATERWQDEQWHADTTAKITEAVRRPEVREKNRQAQLLQWQDPEYVAAMTASSQAMWEDPAFRERMMQVIKPPTISGARGDIGFVALSAWEANFARILKFVGRDFEVHKQISLAVPEELRGTIQSEVTTYDVDFWTVTPRGNLVLYEIMSHPLEDPTGLVKLELALNQYPDLEIRTISPKLYARLRHSFARRINVDDRFRGWETDDSNLRTNPAKFG